MTIRTIFLEIMVNEMDDEVFPVAHLLKVVIRSGVVPLRCSLSYTLQSYELFSKNPNRIRLNKELLSYLDVVKIKDGDIL